MLDLAFVRANLPLVEEKLRQRGADTSLLANFAALDTARRSAITEVETLKAQRNALSQEIGRLKREGKDPAAVSLETTSLKDRIAALETRATETDLEMRTLLQQIPNLPNDSVPVGSDEHSNKLEKTWGDPTQFDFPAKPHWELGESLGILDFARAAKISGARFVLHYGAGARLERALANFMLDLHTREHGYTEVLPPYMVNSKSLFGTGQLPKFALDLFHCDDRGPFVPGELQDSDHWLIPTAEVPVTNIFRDEVIDLNDGTISFTAYTPCFRSEAGSHGKDTRGMIRQHQFDKVELVQIVAPTESYVALEQLTRHAEEVLRKLELPYRVIALCGGDVGFASAKTYDLEVWLPSQKTYREISSCSNCEAFQARRMQARWRNPDGGKPEPVHTLNGSGVAVGRALVAVLENYQEQNGAVRIPHVLRPYMGGTERLEPAS